MSEKCPKCGCPIVHYNPIAGYEFESDELSCVYCQRDAALARIKELEAAVERLPEMAGARKPDPLLKPVATIKTTIKFE